MSKQGENLEIERRWLLSALPGIIIVEDALYVNIVSIYILIEPLIEVRLRKLSYFKKGVADIFSLETKLGSGLIRQETPMLEATAELFN